MEATYTKLRSGEWGIRIAGPAPSIGANVTVAKKSGERKTEVVRAIVWRGEGVVLCAIVQTSRTQASRPRYDRVARQAAAATCRRGGRACSDCGGDVQPWSAGTSLGLCHDCL